MNRFALIKPFDLKDLLISFQGVHFRLLFLLTWSPCKCHNENGFHQTLIPIQALVGLCRGCWFLDAPTSGNQINNLAPPARLQLATLGIRILRSVRLSYGGAFYFYKFQSFLFLSRRYISIYSLFDHSPFFRCYILGYAYCSRGFPFDMVAKLSHTGFTQWDIILFV